MKWDAFAVQAVVMVAACHNPTLVTEYSVEQVVQQLGTWWQNVSKALEQEKDSMFKPSPRKKCKDCVFEESQVCVLRYCHSDQGPHVDTESKWVYKVKDLESGKVESHPAQVWNEVKFEQRFEEFLKQVWFIQIIPGHVQCDNWNRSVSQVCMSMCKGSNRRFLYRFTWKWSWTVHAFFEEWNRPPPCNSWPTWSMLLYSAHGASSKGRWWSSRWKQIWFTWRRTLETYWSKLLWLWRATDALHWHRRQTTKAHPLEVYSWWL